MKYPKFLKQKDLIGVTALSGGTGDEILDVKKSLNNLKKYFRLSITKDCYGERIVSGSDTVRSQEFNELLDEDIQMMLIFRGGSFLLETLDKLDYRKVVKKNIWVGGYSDPTTLLYILTMKYDLATIYGFNAKSYDDLTLVDQKTNLEILLGERDTQHSFTNDSISINGDFHSEGIIIGGCLDAIRNLFGTEYDGTKEFLKKYHDQKIIWYFDIYEMNSVDVYLTLLQMKMMGYFDYTDTILIGKIMKPMEIDKISYLDAYKKVFDKKNVVVDADIGHVRPSFTMINGSRGIVDYKKNEITIKMERINENTR